MHPANNIGDDISKVEMIWYQNSITSEILTILWLNVKENF